MKINVYYGGRGLLDDPTLYVLSKMEDVLKELEEIDISNLTPMDALNTLYKLQNQLKNRW